MKVSALLIAASMAVSTSAFAPQQRTSVATSTELKVSFLDNLVKKPEPEQVVEEKVSFLDSLINSKKTSAKIPVATKKTPPERSFNLFAAKAEAAPAPAKKNGKLTPLKNTGKSAFSTLSNMDLWAPVKDSNDYGGRANKNIKTGKLTERSYVPSGLTKSQYESIRSNADKKKAANYEKNVKKAFKFQDYTEFYMKRGSDENGSWLKLPNLGHDMAKTKYDWSGETEGETPVWTGVSAGIFGKKK